HVSAAVLDGPARLGRIRDRLRAVDPDVIALQEVEPEWCGTLQDALRDRDYEWRLALKQQYQLEGIALFLRRSVFGPVRFREVIYREDAPEIAPTGNVALLAECTFAGRPILLGTTHIKWEPPEVTPDRHRGVIQATQLVAALAGSAP